jgi:hypothetical protein
VSEIHERYLFQVREELLELSNSWLEKAEECTEGIDAVAWAYTAGCLRGLTLKWQIWGKR